MCAMRLTGYADKFGVHPGDTIKFYVNTDGPAEYKAELVQMINGDTNPRGPGLIEKPLAADINKTYPGRKQVVHGGSYGYVPNCKALNVDSFTLQCWIWPTTPKTHPRYWKHGAQGLVTKWCDGRGYGLFINEEGCVEARINEHRIAMALPLRDHAWHFLAVTFDAATGNVVLYHEPQIQYALDPVIEPVRTNLRTVLKAEPIPLAIAAYVESLDGGPLAKSSLPAGIVFSGKYNGKIDSPRLCRKALSRFEIETMKLGAQPGLTERRNCGPTDALSEVIIGSWDFSAGIDTIAAKDLGPYGLDAPLVNCPTRAMTGHNWSGQNFDWKHAPKEYGAIHFHDDDVDDARWEVDFAWSVPADFKSRFYAVKLTTTEGDEDYIPFWVVPRVGEEQSKIAFMVPTISYMAYANEHVACNAGGAELFVYRVPIMQQQNMFLAEHREYGGSIYDTHTDGSGICLSSRLRPILSIRPKYDHFLAQAPWQYPADLHLIYWLETMGYDYDVITDEDVTYDGVARLENYNVIITGSHPEHNSGPQLDALHNYTQRGGRLMYMGADGWYWVHSYHPAYDGSGRGVVTEMRRCESGIRTWRADPGEYYHQGTGELGGMWRFRGRYLHSVAGVGMSSEGFDISSYFTRTPESNNPRVSWAFEGIDYDEKLGNFGLVGGGAAGLELDIVDTMLGSPPHTLAVATSAGRHTEAYLLVMEDFGFNQQGLDGTVHPRVRGDIAYHETPNGGACFSFSSIAYCGSLPWNNCDNNISRLTKNVLDRFAKDGPLPPPPAGAVRYRGRADYESPALETA
ncbi:N,N-dimethylformamidase beta subunit family domain-containing protein [Chelatococcus reniformis]|uniref:Large subunit of N,N-dimethylformamidase n=1 Tax=Chelatococcus reniformis TaxID=1494448 RepID=A0A916XHY4_9HYPH|nr:N,N-dimethylformamidase beta subunit family domain-containing protein [Chelatococcus reniformis]GGC74552.1 large subunit of N,N-dimethylformamidase [Chelatococcus reniformis]